jgi:hypothetical protein
VTSNDDSGDAPDGWSAAPRPLSPTSLFVAIATLALMAAFIIALASAQPSHDVFVVVVSDPRLPVGRGTPVQVLGFERERLVHLDVTVNDAAVDGSGFGSTIPDEAGLRVRGTFTSTDGTKRPVLVDVPRPSLPPPPAVVVSPWTHALAMPVAGAAVFPVDGKAASRSPGRIVLVDDAGVNVVDIDTTHDQRLPDQRLLAVDRSNVGIAQVSVSDVVDVTIRARDATAAVVSITVGQHLIAMSPLVLEKGSTSFRAPLPATSITGDLVVVHVAESLLPSAPRAQLATRVGGWRDDDLLRVDARARAALNTAGVRTALGRALHVDNAAPAIVSPDAAAQAAHHERARAAEAAAARRRYRSMALLHVAVVVYAAWQARARLALAIAAALLVGSIDLGLDAVIDVTGTTTTATTTTTTTTTSESP